MTLSHDHLILDAFALWGDQTGNYSWILDDVDVAIREMKSYLAAGGRSVIDPTNEGIGRNPVALRRISEATGVHIVMGAGLVPRALLPEVRLRGERQSAG